MQVVVVVNAHSRATQAELPALRAAIAKSSLDVRGFYECDNEKILRKRIKNAIRDGMDAVIVGGGDGTLARAVDVVAKQPIALGVIPLGTGNSFAQTIGIKPGDIDGAVAIVCAARAMHVDLGRVNDTYFANFATIGLPAEIGEETPRGLKAIIGKAAYAVAAIKPILTHTGFHAKIKWPKGKLELETQQIVIASGRFFGKTPITPDASITNGKLALFTTAGASQATVAATYLAMAMGLQTRLPGAHALSATSFVVKTKKKQPIAIDGDAYGMTPATFTIAPGALRVFVPAAFAEANDAQA